MNKHYISKTSPKHKIKQSKGGVCFDVFNLFLMLLLLVIIMVPVIHVFSVSLSGARESQLSGVFFWPKGEINFKGYTRVLKDQYFVNSFLYSILYSVGSVLFTLFFTSLTAYPLAISGFCLKKPATVLLTIPMFIGGGMIPTYLLMGKLHLINTIWVMIIPGCVGAYNVILFRTFFQGIPSSLREAAVMDGAKDFTIFCRIYFPLSKAIYATIGLFTFVGKWNDWYGALIYMNDQRKYPAQMTLRKILFTTEATNKMDVETMNMLARMEVTSENIKMAAIVCTMLPVVCIYPFIQKYFVKGVFVGTIKG